MPDDFRPPAATLGDLVYWYNDALARAQPLIGFVADRPGANTLTIMTCSPTSGIVFRPSVRHCDDPGLRDHAEWRQWGAWEFAPITEKLRKMDSMMTEIIAMREKAGAMLRPNQK